MTQARARPAQRSSASRRGRLIGRRAGTGARASRRRAARRARGARPASTSRPSASTRTGTIRAPAVRERAPRAGIAGLLDPRAVAGIEQQPAHELEPLLRAGHDHDLIGLAARAPGSLHVVRDGLAQRGETRGIAVVELGRRDGAERPAREPRPEIDGKEIHAWRARRKARGGPSRRRAAGAHRRDGHPAAGERGVPEPRRLLNARSGGEVVGQLLGHEGARAPPRGEIALRLQLLDGEERRRARHAEVQRQRA